MPANKAAEVDTPRVEWAEKIDVSTPVAIAIWLNDITL